MSGKSLDLSKLPVKLHVLDTVPLEDIVTGKTNYDFWKLEAVFVFCSEGAFLVFQKKLSENFHEVHAEVTDCPDLTKEPYNLAGEGKLLYGTNNLS